jgi:hypothetical protein
VPFPPPVPFRGRTKRREVVGNVVLAALGAVLVAVVLVAVPADVTAMRVLAWYTAAASLLTLGLAVAIATTRQLPTVTETRLGGVPAVLVRTWSGEWWYAVALDVGLVALGATLVALGVAAGGAWAVLSVAPGLVAVYFLVRVALTLTGRRRNPALWVTETEVVHDGPSGRLRAPRTQVRRARRVTNAEQVLVQLDGPGHVQRCPAPWRPRRGLGATGAGHGSEMVLSTAWVGHDTDALAAWLQERLGLDREGYPAGRV